MNAIENQVLVFGAGIVGSTQALALGKAGLNVTLIDRDDPSSKLTESFDGRTSAIALANKRALENLGVSLLVHSVSLIAKRSHTNHSVLTDIEYQIGLTDLRYH